MSESVAEREELTSEERTKAEGQRSVSLRQSELRLLLGLVVLVASVTFLAWGGAKVACNYHPTTYLKFKPAAESRVLGTPKDAALEFQHALITRSFDAARAAAVGPAVKLVDEAKAACGAECIAEASRLSQKIATRATLLRRKGKSAEVLVESFSEEKLTQSDRYAVTQTGKLWKALRRLP